MGTNVYINLYKITGFACKVYLHRPFLIELGSVPFNVWQRLPMHWHLLLSRTFHKKPHMPCRRSGTQCKVWVRSMDLAQLFLHIFCRPLLPASLKVGKQEPGDL